MRTFEAYEKDIEAGARAFAQARDVCEGPHAAGDGAAVAWEIGGLNECQAWLQIVAGVQNKAGAMLQARIAGLIGEDQAAA